jgi:uncharacterized protein YgiM (DUF1202 family)
MMTKCIPICNIKFTKCVLLFTILFFLTGCGGLQEDENYPSENFPHTSHPLFEAQISNTSSLVEPLRVGEYYYVTSSRLNVRSGPSTKNNVVLVLNRNDKVEVLAETESEFVRIQFSDGDSENKYYVSKKYLSQKKSIASNRPKESSNYFMVQNLATEKIRIYKKSCETCAHKMIFEEDVVVGESGSKKSESAVGYFHISSWHKFYQDGAGLYPSWYHPDYSAPPRAGSSVLDWTDESVLPYKGASVRGAFGWFTAKVAPNSRYQWTHGTIGWGSDKSKFVNISRGFWANLFTDPRSHGCTRNNNEAIAYIREMLPKGSAIVKIYAKEAYGDPKLSLYSEKKKEWNYILTKNGARRDGQKADRNSVLAQNSPKSKWLEEGVYYVDQFPTAKPYGKGFGADNGGNGNVYSVHNKNMKGVFLVDEGRIVNYEHPKGVLRGGYKNQAFPKYMLAANNTDFTLAPCKGWHNNSFSSSDDNLHDASRVCKPQRQNNEK